MAEQRLTFADQTFVNALAILALGEFDRGRRQRAFDIARDVLPNVTRTHPQLKRIVDGFDPDAGLPVAVDWPLRMQIADFFNWRMSLAYDAFAAAPARKVRA